MRYRHLAVFAALTLAALLRAQYGPPQTIVGYYPGAMNDAHFVDLDQDGTIDLVTASPYEQGVMWYRGMGNAQYLHGQFVIADVAAPRSLAVTDVDGDGVVDVVVAAGAQNGLLVARNNGFGLFTVDTIATDLQDPGYVLAEDLNSDGVLDLVVASPADDRIDFFPGLGAGSFGAGVSISNTADGVDQLHLGDVDNDGDRDLLAMMPTGQIVAWYANDGLGNFGPMAVIASALPLLRTASLHDLDNDGNLDVLCTYGSNDLVWYPGAGDGTFSASTPIAIISGLQGAWAADMDQDGDLDLITGHVSSSRFFVNGGTGSFTEFDLGFDFEGTKAIVQDINGDGLIDLCHRRQSFGDVNYRLNLGGLDFGPAVVVLPFHIGQRLGAADLDGDGDMDLLMAQGELRPLVVFKQVSPGNFLPAQELFLGTEPLTNFVLQDLDQDGQLDVLVRAGPSATRDLYWLRNNNGTFEPPVLVNASYLSELVNITLADVDGDGDLDHLVRAPNVGWRRNDGGVFSAHITVDASITSGPVVQADLDGDGLPDLIAGNFNAPQARWYRNMGNATFEVQADLPTYLFYATQIHPADLDDDGDFDLVLVTSSEIAVLLNNGDGSFESPQLYDTGNSTSVAHVHDVDGDGDLDIMNGNYRQFRWLPNNGLGQFGPMIAIQPNEPFGANALGTILADMDGDGLLDIVYAEDDAPHTFWLGNRQNSYYRIQGQLFWDVDQDGVRDATELPVPWAGVSATPAPNFPFSSNNGAYQAYVDAGTFTVQPVFDTTLWRITSDSLQYTVMLSEDEPVSAGNDFGLFVNNANSVIDLGFEPPNGICADTVIHWITATNMGTFIESGILALEMDTLFTLLSAEPEADSVANGIHYWSYADLGFYDNITIHLTTIRPDFTALGDSIHFSLLAYRYDPVVPGTFMDTTELAWSGLVACSYDPNDKLADPIGFGEFGAVDLSTEHIDYTIRFQNTGNAAAVTVVLRDTLPPEADLSRLTLLGYSFAPTDLRVDSGRVFTARLQGIMLPDSANDPLGSQGFLSFRMGLLPGLPHLTPITNTAGIYFDFNPPIVTNTTLHTLVDCAVWSPEVSLLGNDSLTVTEGLRYQWYLNDEPLLFGDQRTIAPPANGNYRVEVTSVHGCVAQAEYLLLSVALREFDGMNFGIAPNPATGRTLLWGSAPWYVDHVMEIFDAQGRVLFRTTGNGTNRVELPLEGISAGVYFVSITGPDNLRAAVRLVIHD